MELEFENYRKIKDKAFENALPKFMKMKGIGVSEVSQDEKAYYYENYWLKQKCNTIACYWLAEKIFLLSGEMECENATVIIQRALKACGRVIHPEDSSCIGPYTFCAISRTDPYQLLVAIKCETAAYYRVLAQSLPDSDKFNSCIDAAYA
jgi:lysozyme family protein